MAISDARKRANQKYINSMDEIKVRPPKGTKERWRAAAEAEGLSLQQFIISTVEAVLAEDEKGGSAP